MTEHYYLRYDCRNNSPLAIMDETIALKTDDNSLTAMTAIDSYRKSIYLCDVVILTDDGQRFPAHRIILASASEFFSSMFGGTFIESKQTDVAIRNVEGTVMKMLIEYAYTGEAKCPAAIENVLSLHKAAHYVQFHRLFRLCSSSLRRYVDSSNCLSMAIVADRYDDSDLLRVADLFAARNILLLAEEDEFLSISAEHLGRIVTHDELGVRTEDEVLIILQKWIKHDEESRRDHVQTLSKFVRFPLINFQESSDVLSDLDLVSHYHLSSHGSCQQRIGRDGVLLFAGGLPKGEYSVCGKAVIYEPNNSVFITFPNLKVETSDHKIATSNGTVYALGGFIEDLLGPHKTDVVQQYDPERRQWNVDVQRMHHNRKGFEIVSCSDRIYGLSIEPSPMCEVLDPQTETWTPVSSPVNHLEGRYILSSLTNKVFAIGFNPEDQFGYMKYDPLEDRWCDFKPCSFPSSSQENYQLRFYATTADRLYIKFPSSSRDAIVFYSNIEQFSVVKDFFPPLQSSFPTPIFSPDGLAYDLGSKRMFMFTDYIINVYDERANNWTFWDNYYNNWMTDSTACAVVERDLMLDVVFYL